MDVYHESESAIDGLIKWGPIQCTVRNCYIRWADMWQTVTIEKLTIVLYATKVQASTQSMCLMLTGMDVRTYKDKIAMHRDQLPCFTAQQLAQLSSYPGHLWQAAGGGNNWLGDEGTAEHIHFRMALPPFQFHNHIFWVHYGMGAAAVLDTTGRSRATESDCYRIWPLQKVFVMCCARSLDGVGGHSHRV